MKSTLTTRVLQLAASARQLAASVSAPALALSVRAGVIAVQAVVGRFLKIIDLFDSWGIRDAHQTNISKQRSDLAHLTDAVARRPEKARADLAALTDVIQLAMTHVRRYVDAVQLGELLSRQLGKAAQESARFSETLERTAAFTRRPEDVASWTDQRRMTVHKVQDDTQYVFGGDYFAEDYVAEGDEFFLLSQHTTTTHKPRSDAAEWLDQAILGAAKVQTDSARWADSATRSMTQSLADTLTATDDVDGAASIDDDQEAQFIKARTDQATLADVFSRQAAFSRAPADETVCTDVATRQCGRALGESVVFSENRAAALSRFLTDASTLGDAHSVYPTKIATDQTTLTDAGSLRSQGYCDFSYFAEDYVGTSRTF